MTDMMDADEIKKLAVSVLGSEETADHQLNTPNRALRITPRELLESAEGCEQVKRVLERIEHGVYSQPTKQFSLVKIHSLGPH